MPSHQRTVKFAVIDELPKVAVTGTIVFEDTFGAFTVNIAEVRPARIVTVAGTDAEEPWLESATTSPPVGATEVIVTVPVLDFPLSTDDGLNVSPFNEGGLMVS